MRADVFERNDNPRWVNFILDHVNGSRHSYSKANCLKEYLHSEPNKEINRLENPQWVKFVSLFYTCLKAAKRKGDASLLVLRSVKPMLNVKIIPMRALSA
jgi:hypothetical protein